MTTPLTIPGEGTIFNMKISASFVEVGLVTEVDGPAIMVDPIVTTHLTSTLHTHRPSKLPKPDKCSIKLFFDPSDTSMQQLIATRVTAPTGLVDDFKIVFADTLSTHSNCTFSGFYTSFKLNGLKIEENVGADIEIQLTTTVTWTAGS